MADAINSAGLPANCRAVLQPSSRDELTHWLKNRHKGRGVSLPVYPISTGFNWGLGSRVAPADGCVLLDLSRLNRILYLDVDLGVAVVEPGVTQGQLAKALEGTPFFLNCTASSAHTSLVGSALERGLGTRRSRAEDLLGLHILQADGTELRTGCMGTPGQQMPWRHGIGPSTLELFCQSSLGIAIAATIALLPRQACTLCLRVSASLTALPALLEALRDCQRSKLTTGVIKVYNTAGLDAYGAHGDIENKWHAYLFTEGPAFLADSSLTLAMNAVLKAVPSAQAQCLRTDAVTESIPETALLHTFCGDPSYNDSMVNAIFGVPAQAVDSAASRNGWLFFLPLVPTSTSLLLRAEAILAHRSASTSLQVGRTFNLMPAGVTDLVVSIRFDRLTQAAAAHALLSELHEDFAAAGYFPYRLDVRHMNTLHRTRTDSADASLLCRLKDGIDPFGAIAPGRYE